MGESNTEPIEGPEVVTEVTSYSPKTGLTPLYLRHTLNEKVSQPKRRREQNAGVHTGKGTSISYEVGELQGGQGAWERFQVEESLFFEDTSAGGGFSPVTGRSRPIVWTSGRGAGVTHHLDKNGVIERMYDAVSNVDMWVDALQAAAEFCEADAMLLVYGNLSGGDPVVIEATGFKTEVLDLYTKNHLKDDELVRESMLGPVGLVISSEHRRRGWSFHDTPMYRRLLRPCELRYLAGTAVLNTPKVYASLWMGRSEEAGESSPNNLQRFSELVPHYGRAMAVHHRLRVAEMRAELATGAFDRVSVGVVLLDVAGDPILANREAVRIALRRDGIVFRDRCLAAEHPADSKRLRELIRQVGQSASPSEPSKFIGGGAIRITRSSGQSDYHVVVMPLPKRCQPGDGSGAVAVLFITDPDKMQNPVDFLFSDLYGLTDAESRLVCELLDGCGLTVAAERLGLSRNTVHSQLASVFQKTGTRRQGELLSLLLGGVAPIEAPDATSGFHEVVLGPRDLTN